jgi:hypothetical protein
MECLQQLVRDPRELRALLLACAQALRQGGSADQVVQRILQQRSRRLPETVMSDADAAQVLEEIRHVRAVARQRRFPPGRRKLDRYRQAIAALCAQGASERDIQVWLRVHKKLKVHASTVHRYLQGLRP